jgi:predicted enzyme involved in methoxymalonyl-ACP biosynthesis
MSCRVLGRGVEQMVLREIIHHARVAGITNLIGSYIPTERNGMVRDHYRKLGFAQVSEEASGTTFWRLSTATEVEPSRMTVDRSGFDLTLA